MPERDEQNKLASPVKLPLFSAEHEKVGELEVAGAVFGRDGDVSLLHEAVRMQLANRRSGTASTKTKGLISGGGRKPWRQKGTGRARAGSTRSPIWRHGGTISDRSRAIIRTRCRRKRGARLCLAISDRARNGKLLVVESLDLSEPKTKAAKAALGKLGVKHALIVTGEDDGKFFRAARNLAAHKVLAIEGLNVTTCSITANS